MLTTTVITPIVLAIVLPIVFGWIRRRFPVPPAEGHLNMEELKQELGMRWHFCGVSLGLLYFAGFTWALGVAFGILGQPCGVTTASDGTLALRTPAGFYFLPAGFFALGLCAPLALFTLRVWLGERFPRWLAYANAKASYNIRRVMPGTLIAACLLGGAMLYPMLNNRFALSSTGFESRMFNTDTYPYATIVGIYDVAGFKKTEQTIQPQKHYVVELADKSHWSSEWVMGFFYDEHRFIIDRIAERAGKPIESVAYYDSE